MTTIAPPLFALHDKGTGNQIKAITPTSGRSIVAERVKQALRNERDLFNNLSVKKSEFMIKIVL
jgi:hypothetical protein